MVVGDFYVIGVSVFEPKTHAPLIVYANRVLSFSVASKPVKPIARRRFQVFQLGCRVNVFELSPGSSRNVRRNPM
jgi:hypothetical protein